MKKTFILSLFFLTQSTFSQSKITIEGEVPDAFEPLSLTPWNLPYFSYQNIHAWNENFISLYWQQLFSSKLLFQPLHLPSPLLPFQNFEQLYENAQHSAP